MHATLVIACMLHLSAALVMSRAKPSQGAPSGIQRDEVTVELEPEAQTQADTEAPAQRQTATTTQTPSTMGTVALNAALRPTNAANDAPASESATQVPTPVASSETGDWSFKSTTNNDLLGMTNRALALNAPPAPSAVEEQRPKPYPLTNGGLTDGLDAHDRELGLGRGGPVLSAVEEAARNPGETPPEGSADYEVIVRKGGDVKVSLLNSNDSRSSWEGIMKDIERGVAARTVRLPDNAAGMRFVVHIDAVVQWPDGKRPSKMGTKGIAQTGEVGSSESHPGLDFTRVPMVGVYHAGKVCSGGVVLTPGMLMAGGACSPENVNMPASRIVHGRVVSENRL